MIPASPFRNGWAVLMNGPKLTFNAHQPPWPSDVKVCRVELTTEITRAFAS
jgi:hypothetical protein